MIIRAVAIVLLVLSGASCKKEDEHLARARKQMSSGQWANARTALGQVLKRDARDLTARSLLLYCIDHEDGLKQVAELSMYSLFQLATIARAPGWERVPKELRTFVEKIGIDARKALFDKGIDTKDDADLAAVITGAARYGFDHDQEPERKDADAAVLAIGGDKAAIAYLIGRLKSATPERVVDYLVDVGAPTITGLRAVVNDKGFIGRRPALDALARVLAGERARELVAKRPELKDPTGSSGKVTGSERVGRNVLSSVRDPDVMRVHGEYLALDDGADDGVVLLQTWNDRKGVVVVELYAYHGGQLHKLRTANKDGSVLEIGGPSIVFDFAVERGVVTLRRLQERSVDVEVETGRIAEPKPGMRVRLKGYEPHGEIIRDDGGLWVVKVDKPIEGMNELPVATTSLIGLKPERRTEVSIETITGKVRSDTLEVASRDIATEPIAGGGLPSSCQDYKLLMERLQHCDKLPASTRSQLQSMFDQLVVTWKNLDTSARTELAESCKSGTDSIRQSAASLCDI